MLKLEKVKQVETRVCFYCSIVETGNSANLIKMKCSNGHIWFVCPNCSWIEGCPSCDILEEDTPWI